MINRYKSKEGGTMIPLRFQNGGSNLFLRMPDGGTVGPMGASPMGLPEYQTGANLGGVNEKTMQDFNHYYSQGFPMMQGGGDPNAEEEDEDTSFYSDRMNTFIQKIRDAAEKNLETAVMEQDQQQPMAAYGMSMGSDPMNSYDPGNLDAYAKNSNYLNRLSQNAVSGYIQRMGALGPNDYYYKEKNIYRDRPGVKKPTPPSQPPTSTYPQEPFRPNDPNYANNFGDDLLFTKRDGGSLPKAQTGLSGVLENAMNLDVYKRALEMGHDDIDSYRKSNWGYGKKHPQYKAPSYPSRVHINDPRTINATSGNPINPNVDLKSGDYHTGVIGEIARAAREYGQSPQELMSIALQESNLGKTDSNYGHVLDYRDPQNRGAAYDMAFAKTEKDKEAIRLGYGNDELLRRQAYNGYGTVYPWTELDYHGFPMKSIYGVDLDNSGIDMKKHKLYGKRTLDLERNVLGHPENAAYNQFLDKYNRDLANEEAVSEQQIGTYNILNRFGPQYGNQFRDMMQGAYSDSLDNSAGTEYTYPDGNLNLGYPIPNLDNTRQRNALDRFNKGIGYEQIPYRDGGALTEYQQAVNSGQSGTVEDPNGVAALADKMYAEQGFIKDANGGWVKPETSQNPPASVTANNTGTGVTTTNTTAPNGSQTIGGNGDPNMLYDGHNNSTNENTTVINGVRYAVDPTTREVLGYNPQYPTGPQGYDNYNPYGGYNPYAAYGSMRGRNLGVVSKNRLTKDFREKMLAGSYGNPQLLGISEIKTRRAMDPGNRIKSMTFSYNGNADNTANPSSSSNTTNTANSTNQKPGNTASKNPSAPSTPSNPAAYDMNRTFAQISDNEKKYFATEGDFADRTKKNWKDQKMVTSDMYDTPEKVKASWDAKVMSNPTKKAMWDAYSDMPPALKDIAADHIFNSKSDPRIFTLAAAGAIDMKDSRKYKDDPKLLEEAWNKNKDLVNQQYNDDPQAFTESVSAHRNIIYSKLRADDIPTGEFDPKTGIEIKKPNDWLSTDPGPGVQYNAWSGRTNNTQDYLDKTYFDPAMGYVPYAPPTAYAAPVVSGIPQPPVVNSGVGNGVVTSPQNGGAQLSSQSISSNPSISEAYSTEPNDATGMGQNVRILPSTDELLARLQSMPDNSVRQRLQQAYNSGQLNPQQFNRELKLAGFRDGGSLHRFISKYQQAIDSGQPGTVPNMDWSLPSTDQMMTNYFNQGSDNKISFDGVGGKSIDYNLTNDKVGEMDLGFKNLSGDAITTNLDGTPKVDKTGMGDGFDVESKTKKKRIGNPEKDLAAINFATNLYRGRDAAYADMELRNRSQASQVFNPIRSTQGNYGILSGDFMAGKKNADGNDAFHSGFGNYAQMGGSMMDNLKEGDEVYLTEDQINQIIKRGGKLSYL